MKRRSALVGVIGSLFLLAWGASSARALDERTHVLVNKQAAGSPDTHTFVRDSLELPKGLDTVVTDPNGTSKPMVDWLGEGGKQEDSPHCRSARHFHDPLQPWETAGLRTFNPLITVPCWGFSFPSSNYWAQEANQTIGGQAAWQDARRSYLRALTDPVPGHREGAFADTFRILGQQMHLVADASVPEHVRNDPHMLEGVVRTVGTTGYGSYEYWVSDQHPTPAAERAFIDTYLSKPFAVDSAILRRPTNDAHAPVAVARLIDTDTYRGLGTGPSVTLSPAIGIAEFANANFFSEDTAAGQYPHPKLDALVRSELPAPKSGLIRAYYRKAKDDGEPVEPVLAECLLDEAAQSEPVRIPRTYGCVDENVWAETARHMLPRAVGYARGVLDHFFRGALDGDVVPADPGVVRFAGTNASPDRLGGGTLELYGENADGTRTPLTALDGAVTVSADAGAALQSARFAASPDAERYVAVYKGQLGDERSGPDPQREPGAVIGKVQGGLRVEEIFAEGLRWVVRTPKGLFLLPPEFEEYWDVRWGDAPDFIVAEKGWGSEPDDPWEAVAFRLARVPGSPDFETMATPAGAQIIPTEIGRTRFPLGMAVGTTVELNHTVTYRQQLGRFSTHNVLFWREGQDPGDPGKPYFRYRENALSVSPVKFETVTNRVFPFKMAFPLVLDAAHNPDFATDYVMESTPFGWEIHNVTVDEQGRLVAEIRVTITQPGPRGPSARVPHYELSTTGALEVYAENVVSPSFPHHGVFVWLLVDLVRGAVLASTAGSDITVNAASTLEAFVPFTGQGVLAAPHVWVHSTEEYQGGPRDGEQVDFGWGPVALTKRTAQSVSQFTDLGLGADFGADFTASIYQLGRSVTAVAMEGWARDELKAALAPINQFGAQVDTAQTTDEYVLPSCPSCAGVRITMTRSRVTATSIEEAQRGRGLSAGSLWALIAVRRPGGTGDRTETVLFWDAAAARGAVLANPSTTAGYTIRDVTDSAALVTHGAWFTPPVATLLLPFSGIQGAQIFPGEDLGLSFRLFEPAHLYHLQDLRFYRTRPTLGPTALPAKLIDAPDHPIGDYHVIRLP
jgi:hypothetical protein